MSQFPPTPTSPPTRSVPAMILLVLMLLAFGGIFDVVGYNAAREHRLESHDSRTRSDQTIPGNSLRNELLERPGGAEAATPKSTGTSVLVGTDAVRAGTGLLALGSMLAVWGAALLWSIWHPQTGTEFGPGARLAALGSFALMVTAIICLLPPWQLSGLTLLGVVGTFCAVFANFHKPGWQLARRYLLPSTIGAAILVGCLNQSAAFGMLIGIFVAMIGAAHVMIISPRAAAAFLPLGDRIS